MNDKVFMWLVLATLLAMSIRIEQNARRIKVLQSNREELS